MKASFISARQGLRGDVGVKVSQTEVDGVFSFMIGLSRGSSLTPPSAPRRCPACAAR
ncbi:hypothetical protein [Amycolatopsis sp. cmx-11-12]|uniref:hypothetical protein n=1 Tax=Amycolatopsis sp. cmx-11-12 TaxID=2785795 RepID=UPI003918173A